MEVREMNEKKYICPICGKPHKTPVDMANCVLTCNGKIKREEERLKQEKLEAEKRNRDSEITEIADQLTRKIEKYCRDYNEYPNVYYSNNSNIYQLLKNLRLCI